jgi:hypothetical protein
MRPNPRLTVILLLALIGCGGLAREAPQEYKTTDEVGAPAVAATNSQAAGIMADRRDTPSDVDPATPPRISADPAAIPTMIIRTGQASLEVDSLEVAVAMVRQLAERVGGYVANSQMQLGASQFRTAMLEIKVPAARFDELAGGLAPIGRVEYVNVSAQDVGEEFTDITARVANGHRLEARLIDLLATRTGKLSDVLEIERELARVREEIERMEGRLRYLKAHASISTLSITVHEKAPLVGDQGSLGVIRAAFRQAWRNFVNFTATAIASLGTLLPLGLILLAGILGLRALWRRRQAR